MIENLRDAEPRCHQKISAALAVVIQQSLLLHDRQRDECLHGQRVRRRAVLDHRQAHGFGRTKPEGAGIADVQLHISCPAFSNSAADAQRTTDLVADVGSWELLEFASGTL